MTTKRIAVVFKPTGTLAPPAGDLSPPMRLVYDRRRVAFEEHRHTTSALRAWIASTPLSVRVIDSPTRASLEGADLVVTVGGDGTLLYTARHVGDQPILGVNSSPRTSIGHYCSCTAETFPAALDAALSGQARPRAFTRIAIEVDGRPLPFPALNDVLFANASPVASTRYALRVGETTELQLSSGLWIATASGSSAALRSAGGELMELDDRRLQYLVREPYHPPGSERLTLLGGLVDEGLDLISRSNHNGLFLDGHVDLHPVPVGALARLRRAPRPLWICR